MESVEQLSPEKQIGALLAGNAAVNRDGFVESNEIEIVDPPGPENDLPESEPEPEPATAEPELADEPIDTEPEPDSEPEPALALDLTGIAEKLGIDVADVYDLEIPLGGEREPMTLGQFKDHVQDLYTVEDRQNALDGQKMEHENAVIRDQQELMAIINESGVELSPQLRARAAQAAQIHAGQQRELLLNAIPAWRDTTEYQADRVRMVETLGQKYGMTDAQIGSQQDAVTIKMMHDLTRLTRMFDEANAGAKRVPKVPRRPGKKRRVASKADQNKTDTIKHGTESRDPFDKAKAVSAVLGQKR